MVQAKKWLVCSLSRKRESPAAATKTQAAHMKRRTLLVAGVIGARLGMAIILGGPGVGSRTGKVGRVTPERRRVKTERMSRLSRRLARAEPDG